MHGIAVIEFDNLRMTLVIIFKNIFLIFLYMIALAVLIEALLFIKSENFL